MALTALHEGLRLTNLTVKLDENTGLFDVVYEGEVQDGFDLVPVVATLAGYSLGDLSAEGTHNDAIEALNTQATAILGA